MNDDASAERTKGAVGASEQAPRNSVAENGTYVETAKFDLGAPPEKFDTGQLPWGYGDDRITALVRSPESLYVYWEVTDEAIGRARRRLGAGGEWAWLNVRVYDTTGRDFDGTNANDYFDVRVERHDREWFFNLNRPGASFHVEIGLRSHEGFFAAIARTGRAELPRKSPSPNHTLEWMTVTADQVHPTARPYESKYKGPPGTWSPAPSPPPHSPDARWESPQAATHETRTWTWAHPAHVDVRWEGPWTFDEWRAEWRMRWLDVRGGKTVLPLEKALWRVGPFPIHLVDPDRLEIRLIGDGPILLEESMHGLEVFGPWQVVIRSAPTEGSRRILSTWRVHWVRVDPGHVERWWTSFERRRTGAWTKGTLVGGASEAHVLVEGGASEMWRVGASERWAIGGSEWLAFGASETLGASERALGGASALLYGGSSAMLYGGSSAALYGGASAALYGGASAALGASERLGGASERWSDVIFGGGGE